MRLRPIVLLTILTALGHAAQAKTVKANASFSASNKGTTGSITIIESGESGFMKWELPLTPGGLIRSAGSSSGPFKVGSGGGDFVMFAPLFSVTAVAVTPYVVGQYSFLKLPLWKANVVATGRKGKDDKPEFATDADPFDMRMEGAMLLEQPLLCLYDIVAVMDTSKKDEWEDRPHFIASRERVLDTPLFCLREKREWGDGNRRTEWFDLPLVTTFARQWTEKERYWKVLETPLTTVFTDTRKSGKSESSKTRVLDFLVASVYKRKTKGAANVDWSVLDSLPLTTLKVENDSKRRRLSVLRTPALLGNEWLSFALWRQVDRRDGASWRHVLRLPLIGPVYSSWEEGKDAETKRALFPGLLFWKYPDYAK